MTRASPPPLRILLSAFGAIFLFHRLPVVDAVRLPTQTAASASLLDLPLEGKRCSYTTDGHPTRGTGRATLNLLPSAVLSVPRGGSTETEVRSSGGNALVVKLLAVAGNISPSLEKLLMAVVRVIEKLLGVRLLPVEGKRGKKKRRSKKKQKQKQRAIGDEEDDETEQDNKSRVAKSKGKTAGAKSAAGAKAEKKIGASKPAAASAKHLSTKLKSSSPNYRIQQELKHFLKSPPPNLKVAVGKNIRIWVITMTGPESSIYAGEKHRLRVQFPPDYPTQPPSVYFLQPTPRHEHVYTNGDICLSLLGKDWRPTMTAQSLAVSILSILSGATRKSLPMDNARHATNKPGGKQDDWIYHDDNC